jgi:hypothetical protein
MLREPTLEKLHALRLRVLAGTWLEQDKSADTLALSFDERLALLVEGTTTKSTALLERLRDLERERDVQRRAVAAADAMASEPVKLPAPGDITRLVFDLERRLLADVTKGREELRRFFRDGRIDLVPQRDGTYVARSALLPLVLMVQTPPGETPGSVRYIASSCAGRI